MSQHIPVLVVGINPSSADPSKVSSTIKRLHRWMDNVGVSYFSFVNCISRSGAYTLKDVEYEFLKESVLGYNRVVALGGFPSRALSKLEVEHFVMPHPSRLNRKLNDAEYERYMIEECRKYVQA